MLNRCGQYLNERFPLQRHGPLVLVFSAAAANHACRLAGGAAAPGAMASATAVVLLQFLLMRCADDVKDLEADRRWRPQRALARGLVSLGDLAGLAAMAAALQWGVVLLLRPAALPVLAMVWGWFLLMTAEFFCPAWLRRRLAPYALSHLLIVPLLALLAMAMALPLPLALPMLRLLPFLVCTYGAALGLEVGRKTWRAGADPVGVESYSAAWGWRGAIAVWLLALALALAAAAAVAAVVPQPSLPWLLTPALLLVVAMALRGRGAQPLATPSSSWIVVLYLALGWAP